MPKQGFLGDDFAGVDQLLAGAIGQKHYGHNCTGIWLGKLIKATANSSMHFAAVIAEQRGWATGYGGYEASAMRNKLEQSGRERIKGLCAL